VFYDDRLSDILDETYGTIVYQEQVMQIAVKNVRLLCRRE
jgi:DNA polymerase-3 subunit alpha